MFRISRWLAATGFSLIGILIFAACTSVAPEQTAAPAAPAPAAQSPTSDAVLPQTETPAQTPTEAPEPEFTNTIVTPRSIENQEVPEIKGIASWINSEPLTFQEQRGRVVLVDFWTYTCVNCIRTLPFLKAWHEKYADKGLVIVGVHTPEFEFEKDRENVVDAVEEFGLKWAIAQDNDFGTWRAFNNRFWPAKYLVDADGFIRYTHFGEGSYEETETWIRGLLEEAGVDLRDVPVETAPEPLHDSKAQSAGAGGGLTRELYAGYERNYGALIGRSTPPYVLHQEFYAEQDTNILYEDPGDYQNNFLYFQGLWNNNQESIIHARETENFEDYLGVKFFATSVNAVMAPLEGESLEVRVILNDAPISPELAGNDVMFDADGNGYIVVDESRLYNVVTLPEFAGHELKLSSNASGFALFAYTFGAYQGGEPAKTGPNG